MKKSEMVEKIADLIYHNRGWDGEGMMCEELAELILDEIQKYGMKPPTVWVDTPSGPYLQVRIDDWEENFELDENGFNKKHPNYPHYYHIDSRFKVEENEYCNKFRSIWRQGKSGDNNE